MDNGARSEVLRWVEWRGVEDEPGVDVVEGGDYRVEIGQQQRARVDGDEGGDDGLEGRLRKMDRDVFPLDLRCPWQSNVISTAIRPHKKQRQSRESAKTSRE